MIDGKDSTGLEQVATQNSTIKRLPKEQRLPSSIDTSQTTLELETRIKVNNQRVIIGVSQDPQPSKKIGILPATQLHTTKQQPVARTNQTNTESPPPPNLSASYTMSTITVTYSNTGESLSVFVNPAGYEEIIPIRAVDALKNMLFASQGLVTLEDPDEEVGKYFFDYLVSCASSGIHVLRQDDLLRRIRLSPNRQYVLYCHDEIPGQDSIWSILVATASPNPDPTAAGDLETNYVAVGPRQRLRGEYTHMKLVPPHTTSHTYSYSCSYSW